MVSEVLARGNHGMSIGKFDIDMDSGDTMSGVFSTSLSTADRYFPAAMRVIFAGNTLTNAVYLSELHVNAEAVEAGGGKSLSTANPPMRISKTPKSPRKDSRLKTTNSLPGLFE